MTDKTETPKKRRRKVRYSLKVATFICDKLEQGFNVAEMVRKWPDQLPEYKTIFKWRREHPEFYNMYEMAYQTYIYRLQDELNTITSQTLAELYPNVEDFRERAEMRRARVDALKFQLAKIAPKIVPELKDKQTIEHTGAEQVAVISYSVPAQSTEESNDDDIVH